MKKYFIFFITFFILFSLLQSSQAFHPFPDTGQKKCYDNTGEIPCPSPGQPFYGQDAQYQPRLPRSYTKLGHGGTVLPDTALHVDDGGQWLMTRDNVTGLIWELKTNANMNDEYTWENANDQFIPGLNSASFGGFSDWRLPDVKELLTLVNAGGFPVIDAAWFPKDPWNIYWSSTTYMGVYSWSVHFGGGGSGATYMSNSFNVRAVRSGSAPRQILIDNHDGTVTDTSTGLIWQQCTYGQTWNNGQCTGTATALTWQQALEAAESLTMNGHSDWRLPNLNELQSLIDYSRNFPSIDPLFACINSFYWSSTPSSSASEAWLGAFDFGGVYTNNMSDNYFVRAVRAGNSSITSIVPLYRLYKYDSAFQTRDHFYTTSWNERMNAISIGYIDESILGYVSANSFLGALPLYRLYNQEAKSHYYTTSDAEKNAKIQSGDFEFEKTECYVYPTQGDGLVPVRRLKQNSETPHHYLLTANPVEYSAATTTLGYSDDGGSSIGYVQSELVREPLVHDKPQGSVGGIGLGSGAVQLSFAAFGMNGRGPQLSFVAHYNSFDFNPFPYPMGSGWNHNLESSAHEDLDGNVLIQWPDGTISMFEKTGPGIAEYVDKSGNHDELTRIADVANYGFDVRRKNQSLFKFREYTLNQWPQSDGTRPTKAILLIEMKDWAGYALTFVREAAYGRLDKVHDSYGRELRLEYATNHQLRYVKEYLNDVQKRSVMFEYDPVTLLLKNYIDSENKRTTFVYDEARMLKSVTYPRGNTVTYDYDNATKQASKVAEGTTSATSVSYIPGSNITEVIDPRGNIFKYVHEGMKLVSKSGPDMAESKFEYTDAQNPFKPTKVVDKESNYTSFIYDSNGNIIRVTNAAGKIANYLYNSKNNLEQSEDFHSNNETVTPTVYVYDNSGLRLASVTNPEGESTLLAYAPNPNPDVIGVDVVGITNPLGHQTHYAYDAYGNLNTLTDSLGHSVHYQTDYAGRVLAVTDAKGIKTEFQLDNRDLPNSVTNLASNGQDILRTVFQTYDDNGNLNSVRWVNDGVTSETKYAYDINDRIVSVTNPLNDISGITYSHSGQIESTTDFNSVTTSYEYDEHNRLKTTIGPDETVVLKRNRNGNFITAGGKNGVSFFEYNNLNQLISYKSPYNAKTVGYEYDDAGRLWKLVYPGSNKFVTYGYDKAGRLVTLTDWLGGVTQYTYDDAGNLKETVHPNTTKALYGYDTAERLSALREQKSDGSVICSYVYTYDAAGNIHGVDATEPLSAAPAATSIVYSYDKKTNRLLSDSNATYSYDDNGNRKTKGSASYSWNSGNMLSGYTRPGLAVSYDYDAFGNRIGRTENGVETRYVLDISGEMSKVLAETDAAGNIIAYYIYGLGLVSRIDASGNRLVYHANHRGDIVAMTNADQVVTDAYAYDEFGAVLQKTGSTDNPFTFVGLYGVMHDVDGQYYMRARYYDALNGFFLNADPIGFKSGDWNIYNYVFSNPLINIDPNGEIAATVIDGMAFAVEHFNIHSEYLSDKLIYFAGGKDNASWEEIDRKLAKWEKRARYVKTAHAAVSFIFSAKNLYKGASDMMLKSSTVMTNSQFNAFAIKAAGNITWDVGESCNSFFDMVMGFQELYDFK